MTNEADPLRRRLRDLLLATSLLTRLPLPSQPDGVWEHGAGSVWAYPLAGALVGALSGLCGIALLRMGAEPMVAAGCLLGLTMLLTGAMHEDGLADTADGFWGGWTRERRLDIMKDSRIGTYGVLALVVVTGLRWSLYASLLPLGAAPVMAVAALSRSMMPVLMTSLPPARSDGLSKSVGKPGRRPVLAGLATAAGVSALALGVPTALAGCGMAMAATAGLALLARRKIGGQTGDVLGACQQISEVCALLALQILLI